ncbi:MAG: YcxB family protein, partial [Planctomycetaceae bacterium]|nr:YcxB family protein [Planctomycetaceae bacterium]
TQAMLREVVAHLGKKVTGLSGVMWLVLMWVLLTLPVRAAVEQTIPGSSKGIQFVIAALIVGAFVFYLYRKMRRSQESVEDQDITLIFTEDGIEKRALHSESKMDWKAYEKYMESDKYYFLYFANRTADVVPKSAFQSPDDAVGFRQLLGRKLSSSAKDPHPVLGRTRRGFYVAFAVVLVLLVVLTRSVGPLFQDPAPVWTLVAELRSIAPAQEAFRERFTLDGKPAYWREDVAGLYTYQHEGKAIGLIDRKQAAADASPVDRTIPQEFRFGYVFRSLHFGQENFSDPDRYAVAYFPANKRVGRLTFIMNQTGTVWSKELGPFPRIERFPNDPVAEGWTRHER